jgi:hypothetical protein
MCCLAENGPPNLLDPKDEEKHVEMAVVWFFSHWRIINFVYEAIWINGITWIWWKRICQMSP